jgi:hypothetical protein
VGSARVWDERARAEFRSGPRPEPAALPTRPDGLAQVLADILRVTLEARLGDFDPGRRAELAYALRARLSEALGLPSEATEPSPAPERETPPPATTHAAAEGSPLAGLLEQRLARLGGVLARRADLRQRLVGIALAHLEDARPGLHATPGELGDLDLLARRARKLELSLEETRAALAYVAGLEHVDEGSASIYRRVQGLCPEDPAHRAKLDALQRIYRANVELQGLRASQSPASKPT